MEAINAGVGMHRVPETFDDRLALGMVKCLRYPTDILFKRKYVYRAVMLETIAACPGTRMIGVVLPLTYRRNGLGNAATYEGIFGCEVVALS